jgi:hypothetical protein
MLCPADPCRASPTESVPCYWRDVPAGRLKRSFCLLRAFFLLGHSSEGSSLPTSKALRMAAQAGCPGFARRPPAPCFSGRSTFPVFLLYKQHRVGLLLGIPQHGRPPARRSLPALQGPDAFGSACLLACLAFWAFPVAAALRFGRPSTCYCLPCYRLPFLPERLPPHFNPADLFRTVQRVSFAQRRRRPEPHLNLMACIAGNHSTSNAFLRLLWLTRTLHNTKWSRRMPR